MAEKTKPEPAADSSDFARQAEQRSASLMGEFWDLMRHHRKWWLLPILVTLLLFGVIAVLGSSVVAPFIYTLF